jgi:predicted amidohydrolase YtcJ
MSNARPAADVVFRSGTVLVLDQTGSTHEALALRADRILSIGTNAEIDLTIGRRTQVIELNGLTLLPGFNDTHAHMEREGLKRLRLSLASVRSISDITRRIAAASRQVATGEWIVTMPVGDPPFFFGGPESLAEKRMPDRHDLDGAAPHHPVCILGVFGNWGRPPGYTALNTLALKLNGIDSRTAPQCSGVEIVKDSKSGEPTGVIIEHNSRPTVDFDLLPAVPRFSFTERLRGAKQSMQLYNAVGTTSAYEGHGSAPEIISVYRSLWERGEMSVRVALTVSPTWGDVSEAATAMRDFLSYARAQGFGDHWLRISGVHIAYGGDTITAALARADLPNSGWSGFVEQANSKEDFRDYCMLAAEHDLRVHTIVGDQLHEVIPIIERVAERYPLADRRWVVEHVGRARLDDLKTLKKLGLCVTTIPVYHLWKGGDRYLNEPDGGNLIVPHRHLLDLSIPLASATDNIPYDPLFTLWAICTRSERISGKVIGEKQRLTVQEGIHLLTTAGAWLTFEENCKGPLLPGYLADLTVLSDNPIRTLPENLKDIRCRLTMVGGKIVFNDLQTN